MSLKLYVKIICVLFPFNLVILPAFYCVTEAATDFTEHTSLQCMWPNVRKVLYV